MNERGAGDRCDTCPMQFAPTLGNEERMIIEIYNAVTSDFVRFSPGAFDLAISAFVSELDSIEARKLFVGLREIHDEMIRTMKKNA